MSKSLTKKEWDRFLVLMEKIVNQKDLTNEEKAATVKDAVRERGAKAVAAFEDFTTWDWE